MKVERPTAERRAAARAQLIELLARHLVRDMLAEQAAADQLAAAERPASAELLTTDAEGHARE